MVSPSKDVELSREHEHARVQLDKGEIGAEHSEGKKQAQQASQKAKQTKQDGQTR